MKDIATRQPLNGDVVRLRSGGPLMTVEHYRSDGFISVRWFERVGEAWEHKWDAFHPDCLVYADMEHS